MPRQKKSQELPEREDALRQLFRRQVRAIVALVLRMVLLAMLSAFLLIQWPALRQSRWILDTVTGMICVGGLLKEVARNWSWRIGLGVAYLKAGRYADAELVLKPLDTVQGQLFDPGGQGASALAKAREELGKS